MRITGKWYEFDVHILSDAEDADPENILTFPDAKADPFERLVKLSEAINAELDELRHAQAATITDNKADRVRFTVYAVVERVITTGGTKEIEEVDSAAMCSFKDQDKALQFMNECSEQAGQAHAVGCTCDDDADLDDGTAIPCAGCGIPIPDPGENPDPAALLCDGCYDDKDDQARAEAGA